MSRKTVLFALLVFFCVSVYAQNTRTITGQVRDSAGPVSFASIWETSNKKNATTADASGNFSLRISSNQITFSAAGYQEMTLSITGDVANVTMIRGEGRLQEVVVIALGLRRTRNQVPYAAQTVNGAEISKNRGSNFITNLSGKVAGLDIKQTNTLGGSTNAVIRGFKSITGDNQALFVIDGVPFNNANTNTANQRTGRGGYDFGNAAADINPDDIESITVLKGAAASALYGSQGANGVILITTKKGSRGLGITLNSGVSVGAIDKSTFPKYQKEYGGGYGKYYEDATGNFLYRDPAAGFAYTGAPGSVLVVPVSEDASYGAAFNPALTVYQ